MRTLDLLALAGQALASQRRRTALSLLGVSIGVAAVVVLTALGEGAKQFVYRQFEGLSTNVLGVLPGKVETTGGVPGFGGVPNDLTLADAEALRRAVPQAVRVAPVCIGNDTVSSGDRSRQAIVLGSTRELQGLRKMTLRAGSFLPDEPWDRGSPVTVLGGEIADELFPGENPLGRVVRVGSWRMRVIGVLSMEGVHFGMNMDEVILVPVATGMRMFNRSSLFRVPIEVASTADLAAAERRITALLRERHGEEDFTIVSPDAVIDSLGSILGVLTMALAGIAAISLGVAGIGIMNVMLVAVSERTSEIGLCKAIGARPSQILAVFLVEAVLLSVAGALVGLGLGYGLAHGAILFLPDFPLSPPKWAVAAAIGVSIAVGVVFGVLPARRAVRLDPVAALSGGGV